MAHKFLARDDAPFGAEVWEVLDRALVDAAKNSLVGRRLLHVEGPYGLGLKSIPLHDVETEEGLIVGRSLPLVMIREPFSLGLRDLAAFDQNHLMLYTREIMEAAREVARMEDRLIFQGTDWLDGLMTVDGAQYVALSDWGDVGSGANDIIAAVTELDRAGFHGPYTMALAPGHYNRLLRRYPQGNQTELEHVQKIVTDGVFKARNLEDGGVIMASGRQYASLILGQDMTIGFVGPAEDQFEFYIVESLVLRIRFPEAICVLGTPTEAGG